MPVAHSRAVLVTVLVALAAGTPAVFLLPSRPNGTALGAYGVVAAGLLFVIAGALRLAAWKATGRAALGWLGCASLGLGMLLLVSSGLSDVGTGALPQLRPADQLVASAVAGWLVWRGIGEEEVNAGLSPLVVLCWSSVAALALVGGLNAAQVHGLVPRALTAGMAAALVEAAAAGVWVAVGCFGSRAAVRGRDALSPCDMAVVSLLAFACAVRGFPEAHWASTVASAGCLLGASVLGVGTGVNRLSVILQSRDRSHRTLQRALAESVHQAANDRQRLEELLHDVRNAVAGLQAADAVLRDGFVGGLHRHPELADAVTAELARLHVLVDPSRQLRVTSVALADAVQPVVVAERAKGATIQVHLGVAWVLADGGALGRVLQNVLTNARLYAPHAPVAVTAVRAGSRVEISVHDGGPGIPAAERATVFERGSRGVAAVGVSGSGLGLYVARTLMGAMGGNVRLESREPGGCCVVLSVPAAFGGTQDGVPTAGAAAAWERVGADLQAAV